MIRRRQNPDQAAALILLGVLLPAMQGAAEDVVISQPKQGRGTIRTTGQVVDFTGQVLTVRRAGNREEKIESSRVVEVQSSWVARHRAGDERFSERKYDEALRDYQAALPEEQREWVRRRILAQIVWCYRSTGQPELAAEAFQKLYRNDPTTQYFASLPISWIGEAPGTALEQKARTWLASDLPPMRLMAASWLLPTAQRAASLACLQELLTSEDPRVAHWSEAQLWRTHVATATAETVGRWRMRWAQMPAALQPGPAFVLGQACSRLEQPAEAALLFLRAPILQPLDAPLASQALLAAGREFETMNQLDEAANVYREIVADYSTSAAAPIAQQRLSKRTK